MKPGTKSRKLGLEIPTVNPCNDFIVDYLIRNKIKSDKQVLTKSYLYNLAIQAVRKYPLPLICQEQLAALEGFGNFFIGQVGLLIKRHYLRGRLPTEKEMEEDDLSHFEALRAKKKPDQKQSRAFSNMDRDDDSPVFGQSSRPNGQDRRKQFIPKRGTEPFHILQSLLQLKADENPVTKGHINEILYNHGKQKIRLWYVLRQKMQQFGFIIPDEKDLDYIYLTKKGRQYVQNYDKEEEERNKRRRKKKVIQQVGDQIKDQQIQQQQKSQLMESSRKYESSQPGQELSTFNNKGKSKGKQSDVKVYKNMEMEIKKINFAKTFKIKNIAVLVNQKGSDISQKQKLLQKCEDISYEFCEMELADFLWTTDGKVLDYIALRIKESQFDEQKIKTAIFRAQMTTCSTTFIIFEQNSDKKPKIEQQCELKQEEENGEQNGKQNKEQNQINQLLRAAIASGFRVIRTQNLTETINWVRDTTIRIFNKIQNKIENLEMKMKKSRKQKREEGDDKNKDQCGDEIKHLGELQKINKKLKTPYELGTITNECLKCIPDIGVKCQRTLLQKFPTLATLNKKTQDESTTKQKRLLLYSFLIDEKVNETALTTLVQILSYETY